MQTIEQRLEALERSNRCWKTAGLTMGALLLAISSMAAALPSYIPDVLFARRVEIVNEQGQRVAVLGQVNGQGSLSLYDRDGKLQMLNSATDSGGLVSLWNGDRQLLRAGNNGAGGTIDVLAGNGQAAVRIATSSTQTGYVGIADSNGHLNNISVAAPVLVSPVVVPATTSAYGSDRFLHDKFTD